MEAKQAQLNGVVESLGTAKFGVPTVSRDDVVARLEARDPSLVLLDVRSQEERDVSTIPGAITKAQFEAAPERYADKDVVCFCTVGYISGAEACAYRRKGHNNVKNMGDGALLGYTLAKSAAGVPKPLVKPDGTPTNDVHIVHAGPGAARRRGHGCNHVCRPCRCARGRQCAHRRGAGPVTGAVAWPRHCVTAVVAVHAAQPVSPTSGCCAACRDCRALKIHNRQLGET
jgi:rhodanese-related sulfurtransferase